MRLLKSFHTDLEHDIWSNYYFGICDGIAHAFESHFGHG